VTDPSRADAAGRRRLTALVPTLNEEEMIRGCLESVRFADEILVVDSFSTDRTQAIARELGARVIQRRFTYPADQKNWAIPQARHEWILLLDADERATPALCDEVGRLLRDDPPADGFWIRRVNYFLGRPIRRCGWGSDRVIRLFRRDVSRYQDRRVHEEIDLPGPLPVLRHPLEHHTFRSFGQYFRKLDLYSAWGAEQMALKGRRAGAIGVLLRPIGRFVRMYVLRLGFLEGGRGLVLSMLGAFSVYLKYARLWERDILGGTARAAGERDAGPSSPEDGAAGGSP
jgi:glycosyltransferase involved in cell wall biosynthesis